MTVETSKAPATAWWSLTPEDAASELTTGLEGLTSAEAATRLEKYGPNQLTATKAQSFFQLALRQFLDPMNLMLTAVALISLFIDQLSTAILVGLLVAFNIVTGARQEQKAQASVDALATMQVPQVRVRRDGAVITVPAPQVVPGDIVELEAGDIVPADGRVVRASTLETQEASLTGESTPIEKTADALTGDDIVLGDRKSMVYQNTSITRGTATVLVVATGMTTEMGAIATMLSQVERVPSPLQKELGALTKVIGSVAWGAVAVIIAIGLIPRPELRGPDVPRHRGSDLGHSHRHADVRAADAGVGRQPVGGLQGHHLVPQRRRDARGHERHLLGQDRHADHERDDGAFCLDRRPHVHCRRRRLFVRRHRSHLRWRTGRDRPAVGARARVAQRRHRERRRRCHR